MLLSCFALIHSSAVAVMAERHGTPPRQVQASGIQILKDSPGTTEEKRKEDAGSLSSPPPATPDFDVSKSRGAGGSLGSFSSHLNYSAAAAQASQQYLVYMALTNPENRSPHVTLRKVFVDKTTYRSLLETLRIPSDQQESNFCLDIPCSIGFTLHRDQETGLVSSSRSIVRGFEKCSPDTLSLWIEASERLNQSSNIVSSLLACIPASNPELGHYPIAHTQLNICQPGQTVQLAYTQCHIQIRKISDLLIQGINQEKIKKIEKLEEVIKNIDLFLQMDTPKTLPEWFHGKTIRDALEKIQGIYEKKNKCEQSLKRITAQLSQEYACAREALRLLEKSFNEIYREIVGDEMLRPLFLTARPNVSICRMIASLTLQAMRRDMGQTS